MTLNEMRQLLESRNIQLTKSLGQNFLHDGNQLRRIVASAGLIPTDRVLEIGPGLGPLTESLVTQSASVLAIEKDERLVQVLRERFPSFRGQIEINAASSESTAEPVTENRSIGSFEEGGLLHADALRWLQATRRDWTGWKLVANLPYSVASPILVELAMALVPPDRMVATLQAEVVRRIAAAPDTDDYGILTLLLGLQFEVKEWFGIPRGCFYPAPEVDSACVTLIRRPAPLLGPAESENFVRLVKLAFSQRRKMMLKLLKQQWPADLLAESFKACGISATERAEKLGVETFVALTQLLGRNLPH